MANFQKLHLDLPAYLQTAITHYVDELETAEIMRLLAEDDARLTNQDDASQPPRIYITFAYL